MPRRKSRSQAMVDAFRSLLGSGSVSYFTDDSFEGMASELAAQIGGTTSTTYNFTNGTGTRLADNDTVYAALNKLDQGFVDLKSTANGKGASLIGIEDVAALLNATTVEGALAEISNWSLWVTPQLNAYADQFVVATVTVPDTGGGGTDAALTLSLGWAHTPGSDVGSAREVMIVATAAGQEYMPTPVAVATVTFSAPTVGTIVASGAGWALVRTNATGDFACTVSDSADETVMFRVQSASAVSSTDYRCLVVGCVPDQATWS